MNREQYKDASSRHLNRYKMAHCIGVAEYMRDNAEKYGLDKNEMYAVGLMHDIGYLEGRVGHEMTSCEILEGIGAKDDVLFAVVNHGTSPYEVEKKKGSNLLDVCPTLVLLYEGDMSVNTKGYRVGFEKRLEDIGTRYGYDHIAYKTASETVKYVKECLERIGEPYKPKKHEMSR